MTLLECNILNENSYYCLSKAQHPNFMKRLIFLLATVAFVCSGYAQTIENIRVTQEGDQLKITYRIGASNESQLYRVFLSCSMAGAPKFEPKAVIGDVGENVVGGKSYYMVMWDVFEDVDEVINPNITVRVELMSDLAAPVSMNTQEEALEPEPQQAEPPDQMEDQALQSDAEVKDDPFRRNGFVAYSGMLGFGTPIGISFGSLNNWGYYVTPLRMGIYTFDYWDGSYYVSDFDLNVVFAAGATKHFVSGGPYRLHGYAGLGGHVSTMYAATDPYASGHFLFETGVVNVIGGFNLTLGIMISAGYTDPVHLVFGIGFVF